MAAPLFQQTEPEKVSCFWLFNVEGGRTENPSNPLFNNVQIQLEYMAILVNGKPWDSSSVLSLGDVQKKQKEAEIARQKAQLSENRGHVYDDTLKAFNRNMNNINGSFIGADPLRVVSVVRDDKDNIVVKLSNRTPDSVTDADKFAINASTTTILKSVEANSDGGTTLTYRLAGEPTEPSK